jgi:hypothetical protein
LAAAATTAATSSARAGVTSVSLTVKWVALCALGGAAVWVGATRLSQALSPNHPAPVASAALEPISPAPVAVPPQGQASAIALAADVAGPVNAEIVAAVPSRVASVPRGPSSQPVTISGPAIPAPAAEAESTASGVAAQPAPVAEAPPGLAAEVLALREARRALASGQPSTTLQLLDAYETRFVHPVLLPEATVMRIEALLALGRTGEARTISDRLLAEQPNSAYAQRVRSLLGAASQRP